MSESELAVIKPEQVEEEVAMFCPMICREIVKNGTGSSKNHAIALPERVNPASLSLILDYCRFHQVPGRSNKERKSFDEKFVRIDTERLCELTSAADSLQLKPLVDLTSRALARIIEGKTPEEIRDIFHLPDDLTEEEKLEPLKNINDDPRIRLLNRLYAKKRKELQERQKLKDVQVQEEQKDERSLDELLCFINGDGGSGGGKAAKSKKKNKRRKDQAKNPPKTDSEPVNKECVAPYKVDGGNISRLPCQSPDMQDDVEDPFEDADLDDGLDPAMKEELDREVEDFARRLNSVWPERMHLGQDRRIESHIGGNGSLHRFPVLDSVQRRLLPKPRSPHSRVNLIPVDGELGNGDEMELPEWVDIVKTARFKELPPYDPDWYCTRAASIARKIYLRQGIGVGGFQKIYGGRQRNGSRPPHFCKSSGAISRNILQQLQKMGIIDVDPKGGRLITSQGRRDLDQVAGRVAVEA